MKKIQSLFLLVLLFAFSCSDDDGGGSEPVVINALDFTTSFGENTANDEIIGNLEASTTSGVLIYTLVSASPAGALAVDSESGLLTVADASLFDFETNPVITGVYRASVGQVTEDASITINLSDEEDFNIWQGDVINFSKGDGADPGQEANQDRITDNVWITRGNDGGQIYNAVTENSADKNASPAGTEWAEGNISNISNLTFTPFREAVGQPNPSIIGRELVLHLIQDDIYMQVVFTGWSSNKNGGFAYDRPGSKD